MVAADYGVDYMPADAAAVDVAVVGVVLVADYAVDCYMTAHVAAADAAAEPNGFLRLDFRVQKDGHSQHEHSVKVAYVLQADDCTLPLDDYSPQVHHHGDHICDLQP